VKNLTLYSLHNFDIDIDKTDSAFAFSTVHCITLECTNFRRFDSNFKYYIYNSKVIIVSTF